MGLRAVALAFSLPLLAQQTLAQQNNDLPWRRMLESKRQVTAYLEREARRITDRAAVEIATPAAWEKVRSQRLEEMRDMLGLLPWPARTPLNIRITDVLDKPGYTIEKIAFESLPKIYVTGNLYIPKRREGRLPGVIYVCGHSYSPHGDKTKYQRHGISLARNGYVAFILDSIQIAETFALHHGVHGQELYDWYSRGYTPAGVEVWNAMRAIDYLETRPEVDKDKIGMTGRSGGAAMSWFTAAVDPRVKVVSPVMGISTYAANVRDNTQRRHCDCMFPINALMHDMLHQGALIAPRPLLMMHGKQDALFPVAGYEEFNDKVGALYKASGAAFNNVVVETGHLDSEFLRGQAIGWFDRHLKQIPERKLDLDYSDAPEESLAVFAGSPPADAKNYRVHETFTTAGPPQVFSTLTAWHGRAAALHATLRAKVFRAFPSEAAAFDAKTSTEGEIEFTSEPGIRVRALIRRPQDAQNGPALLYVASDGEDPAAIFTFLAPASARVRMAVYPRGVGEVPWDRTFWRDTLRNAMHTGRTVDSMRLYDVMRSVELLRTEPGVDPNRVMVVGRGALALYAAILDPKIAQVMLLDASESHRNGPIFLNVMRYTDLPEAAALIAPRPLIFYGNQPAAYEHTRRIYALHGKPEFPFLSMNVSAVLEDRYDHNFSSGR